MKVKKILKKSLFKIFGRPIPKVHVISYPKCGRTWLTVMVGEYIKRKYNLVIDDIIDIHNYSKNLKGVPNILFGHDDKPLWKTPLELETNKKKYKDCKVIFIARDPRDVIVSAFFERTKRVPRRRKDLPVFKGTLSDYLKQDVGGIDTIIAFYNIWLENKSIPRSFGVVKYEDLKNDPFNEVKRILKFMGLKKIDNKIVRDVVDYSRFENMQRLEKSNDFKSIFLTPGDNDDNESFKVRKGKVGGYFEYLNHEEIEYLNTKIKDNLNNFFQY